MDIFSFIKSRVSIFDVINEYTALKKAGTYWRAHCPFHSEKTASFTVSPHKDIFYCFGCHCGGDLIAFISKIEQCSPAQAVRYLAERYNIELPSSQAVSSETIEHKERYFTLCKQVALWCNKQLMLHRSPQEYLRARSISAESIAYFTIGYLPSGLKEIQAFIRAMASYQILPHDLLEAHILFQGKKVFFSPFEDRIIFPIKDHLGRFCGFGGRIFKPADTRPKYYNSHENPFFSKGSLLFGFDLAKKAIQTNKSVILVEGYTDCVAMVQHGFTNTVATLGTACSAEHLKQLSHHAHLAIVMYDGDNAGQQALLRLSKLCWQTNLDLKIAPIAPQEDPASLLNKKVDLRPIMDNAQEFFTFFVNTLAHEFSNQSLSEKMARARTITETIASLEDPLKQEILLAQASKILDLSLSALKQTMPATRLGKNQKSEPVASLANPTPEVELANPACTAPLEKKIFLAIMHDIRFFNEENSDYFIHFFSSPYRDIFKRLKEAYEDYKEAASFQLFFGLLDPGEQQLVSRLCLEDSNPISPEMFASLLARLQQTHWKTIVKRTVQQLNNSASFTDPQQIDRIIENLQNLQKKVLTQDLSTKKKVPL